MEKPDIQRPPGRETNIQDSPLENGATSENGDASPPDDGSTPAKKPALLKRTWVRSGLNALTLQLMFKGALAPTIAIAIYQASTIAEIYSTLGYLVAIMSILSMPIMPRSKFIQTMFLNIIGICIGACIALLTVYSSVQARNHTTPIIISTSTGAPTTGGAVSGYNSSASAVSAIWLFANIYFVNALRTSRPQLQLPVIMYSIFAMISATYAPSFPTMSAGISFVERLLEAFTLAFAISTGVNFFVFPMTCRGVFFKQSAGMIGVLQGALIAQKEYVQSLEKEDMFKDPSADLVLMPDDKDEELKGHEAKHHHFHKEKKPERPVIPPQAKLKAMIAAIGGLQGQMYADISFAKREVAYGKLDASDIDEIHHHIRDIILPIYGMSSVADIFGRVAEKRGWVEGPEAARMAAATKDDPNHDLKKAKIKQWNEVMRILHVPFETMTAAMCEGLQHVSFVLELTKPPEASKRSKTYDAATAATGDEEADAGMVKPGDLRFSKHLKERIDGFYAQRQSSLTSFMQEMGDGDDFSSPKKTLETGRRMSMVGGEHSEAHKRNQRQLYMVLYMQFLLFSIGRAVLKFVEYADRRVEEGAMKKNRFILPGNRRLRKWVLGLWKKEDMSSSESTPDSARKRRCWHLLRILISDSTGPRTSATC